MQFNKQQEQALYSNLPLICFAGPGAGKTKTLIQRILVDNRKEDIYNNVLILTFTRTAAEEIKDRLCKSYSDLDVDKLRYIGTLHSFFAKLLFTDLSSYLAKYIKSHKVEFKNVDIIDFYSKSELYTLLNNAINLGLIRQKHIVKYIFSVLEKNTYNPYSYLDVKKFVRNYFLQKREEGILTYTDILYFTHLILKQHKSARELIKRKFVRIYIDEAQDTNILQYKILEFITNNNYFLVGDPLQSIYSFLNVNPYNFYSYAKKSNVNVVQLTKNYRSTKNIVKLINNLMQRMLLDVNLKDLEAVKEQEGLVKVLEKQKEQDFVDLVQQHKKDNLAILVRNNKQVEFILKMLTKNLITNVTTVLDDLENKIYIGTIHSVKGREFNNVIVYNFTEQIKKEEEEKRLLYVAVSRAKNNLYLVYPFKIPLQLEFLKKLEYVEYTCSTQITEDNIIFI